MSLLSEVECKNLYRNWNSRDKDYPSGKTVFQLFEEQVCLNPEKTAVVFEDSSLSYAELNARANQLARFIRAKCNIQPDTIIALCFEKSLEMVVAMLATMKAGAAYVPIDPQYPQKRIEYILRDTKSQLILTQARFGELLSSIPVETTILLDSDIEGLKEYANGNLSVSSTSSSLAYVIYTSGSSGKPKGVMVEHASANYYLTLFNEFWGSTNTVSCFCLNYCFDASLPTLFSTLLAGGTVCVMKDINQYDAQAFQDYLEKHHVNLIRLTPSILVNLIDQLEGFNNELTIVLGGETLDLSVVNRLLKNENISLFNQYGPTECIVGSSVFHVTEPLLSQCIGHVYPGKRFYVLDESLDPLPTGETGELYIGGAGIARGYLNQPDLTREKFIANPFASEEDLSRGYERMYRTGDLVRWLADGNVEYVGRKDEQIKVCGYRIELGEIENVILGIDGIRQACVLVKERSGGKTIVAYYHGESSLTHESILDCLSLELPSYMIPSALVSLDEFPLTVNGKIDRSALPAPVFIDESNIVPPETDLQSLLCEVWKEVLQLEDVGISDDFFRIGGDSILSIQLSSKLRKKDIECSVKAIFEHRTIQSLSQYLESMNESRDFLVEEGILEGSFDLLPVQAWFFDEVDQGFIRQHDHWNQSFLVKVPPLDIERLQSVVSKLAEHHDILRAVFPSEGQCYLSEIDAPQIKFLKLDSGNKDSLEDYFTEWQSHFDITQGSLWSVGYVEGYQDGSARIFFAFHHLIIDTVSWRILIEDFKSLYQGESLAKKSSSYRQWVGELSGYKSNYGDDFAYWRAVLDRLPLSERLNTEPNSETLILSEELTDYLIHQANKAYHTSVDELLLTALVLSLSSITRKDSHWLTLEGHGREPLNESLDHSRTVGWFTSMYPVELEAGNTLGESIKKVKECIRGIPRKGIGFGACFPEKLIDLPNVSFNYLGQFDSQDGYWQVVNNNAGISRKNHCNGNLVTIIGGVIGRQLSLRFISRLQTEEQNISDVFHSNLSAVISHCKDQTTSGKAIHTPSDFKYVDISQSLLDNLQKDNEVQEIFPASSLQQGFIYHSLNDIEDDAYRVQKVYDYHESLDIELYIQSWKLAIQAYPILRTAFSWEEEIIQIIHSSADLTYEYIDICDLPQAKKESRITRIQEADRQRAFDLTQPCLLRIYVIKQSADHYTILKSEHHIISDGWSEGILLSRVHEYYLHLRSGQATSTSVETTYLSAQKYYAKNRLLVDDYWRKKIAVIPYANDLGPLLSTKRDLSTVRSLSRAYDVSLDVSGLEYDEIKALAHREGVTLNAIVQFAWHKLIQIYTQDSHTVVGTTVSGRAIPVDGIESSVGLYINTLPLLLEWSGERTILEQLKYIHSQITEISTYNFANLSKLQNRGERLFHSILVHENYSDPSEIEDNLSVKFRYAVEKLDYPLTIAVYESSDYLSITLKSDDDLLARGEANSHLQKLKVLLKQICDKLGEKHTALSVLDKDEYNKILYQWNLTDSPFPSNKTISEIFEAQVQETPNEIAVVSGGQQLTYEELNKKSNQLAHFLQKNLVISPDTLIGLCLERNINALIGILGILKAGAAYLPIDPSYPSQRIQFILEDSKTEFVLTSSCVMENLQKVTHLPLLALDSRAFDEEETTNLSSLSQAENLAYVIYTSGTTGNAKGVMIEHQAVINFAIDNGFMDHSKVKTIAGLSSIVFDGSVFDIFVAILSGKTYLMCNDEEVTNLDRLAESFIQNQVDTVFFTTALLNAVVENKMELLSPLKQVLFGGEMVNGDNVREIISHYPELILIHVYGPTETVVYSTFCELTALGYSDPLPIGKGLDNKKHYILDASLNPVPVGVTGELYIGGTGIARGYLNQPDLTREKFIANPFAREEDLFRGYERMYRTGDLVRWLADGNIEYVGRKDEQVKIRGYRIELGEIENAILGIDGIRQACVLVKERSGGKTIVAYYHGESSLTHESILDFLSSELPSYMIPSALVSLDEFPLTVNGKIDRSALPAPVFIDESNIVPPETDLQSLLCEVWKEVLQLEEVGISDDFFRIGGDSILSIQLSSKLRKRDIECSVKAIFEHRTIQSLSQYWESMSESQDFLVEEGILEGSFDLLPVQAWFFDEVDQGFIRQHDHWNQSFLVKVPQLDIECLQSVVSKLAEHHDILRVVFPSGGQCYYLSEIDAPQIKFLKLDSGNKDSLEDYFTEWQSHFDITQGPLWSVGYVEGYQDGSARLFFAFHHLIIDTVSWRILIEDVKSLYEGDGLSKKSSSYRQWVNEVAGYESNYSEDSEYWQAVVDRLPSPERLKVEPNTETLVLSEELTGYLIHQANKAYHTNVDELLLTALVLSLSDTMSSTCHWLTLEGHGREPLNESLDHSRTVGWFTSMYPVELETGETLGESIKKVKECIRGIPRKGIGFGACFPEKLIDLPKVSFNYLGQFDGQDRDWQIVNENAGVSMNTSNSNFRNIDINGLILGGQLHFKIEARIGCQQTERLCSQFKDNLEKIIRHTQKVIDSGAIERTPVDFSTVSISSQLLDNLQAKCSIEAIYLATSLQQGFIYHALRQPKDDAYRVQLLFDYHAPLALEHYIRSWELAVEKHPILRTAFNWEKEILQIVYSHADLKYEFLDISDLSPEKQQTYIRQIQHEDRQCAFDLTQPCLLRLYIFKHSENHYSLLKSEHHSISDGWSEGLLLSDVHKYYAQLQSNQAVMVSVDNTYIAVQEYCAKYRDSVNDYWNKKVADIPQVNDLRPLLLAKNNLSTVRSLSRAYDTALEISGVEYDGLKRLCQCEGVTLNAIVQFAWHKLIQIYTQDSHTVVGTTISGRALPLAGIESSVGLYINTLPLLLHWENDNSVLEQLQEIHEQITQININGFANLADFQNSKEGLFQSILVFENYPRSDNSADTLDAEFRYAVEKLDYPLGLTVYVTEEKLTLKLKSDQEILSPDRAEFILSKIKFLIDQVIHKKNDRHNSLTTLNEAEYKQLVVERNKSKSFDHLCRSVVEIFEEQVERQESELALIVDDQQLGYRELNKKINQLARFLSTQMNVNRGDVVALYFNRGIDAIVGMMSALKLGAAYLPLEIDMPIDRVQHILDETQPTALLTNSCFCDKFSSSSERLVYLDQLENQIAKFETSNLNLKLDSNELAYVMYTSGSTGVPKGSLIEHRSIVRLVKDGGVCPLNSETVMLNGAPLSFDAATFEIYGALLNGGTLVISSASTLDFERLPLIVNQYKINTLWLTAALFDSWSNTETDFMPDIKYLLTGGDVVSPEAVAKTYDKYPDIQIINGYGPTENTTFTATYPIPRDIDKTKSIPIGVPVNHTQVYILDKYKNPVPVGVQGELYTSGAGIARGYLNQEELSEQVFISNPFSSLSEDTRNYEKLYKTGDLARWLPDGNIEFIGRNDFQVKVRGFRVELEEIERSLMAIDEVKQACVIVRGDSGNKQILAYVVADISLNNATILTSLSELLPKYMLPNHLMQLDSLPITANGKVDRRLLPDPSQSFISNFEPPGSELEKELCLMWQDVLGTQKIGVTDDFFSLGGNSILAIQLSHCMSQSFGLVISVADLFSFSTVRAIGGYIQSLELPSSDEDHIWEI